jgi:hypothetical protein
MKVKWFKGDVELHGSTHLSIMIVDSMTFTLTIYGADMSDAGIYKVQIVSIRYHLLLDLCL